MTKCTVSQFTWIRDNYIVPDLVIKTQVINYDFSSDHRVNVFRHFCKIMHVILDPMNEPGPALRDEAIEHRGSNKEVLKNIDYFGYLFSFGGFPNAFPFSHTTLRANNTILSQQVRF